MLINYSKDPENYWARDIMIKINRYLISQDLSLEGFLMSMNMASDDTMSQFDFLAAISAAVSGEIRLILAGYNEICN